jgi:hypothetical protein
MYNLIITSLLIICLTIYAIVIKLRECRHSFALAREWNKVVKEQTTIYHINKEDGTKEFFWLVTTECVQQDRCKKCGRPAYHTNTLSQEYEL